MISVKDVTAYHSFQMNSFPFPEILYVGNACMHVTSSRVFRNERKARNYVLTRLSEKVRSGDLMEWNQIN